MRKTTPFLALAAVLALTACETIGGAGRDISTAGQVIQRESNEAQY